MIKSFLFIVLYIFEPKYPPLSLRLFMSLQFKVTYLQAFNTKKPITLHNTCTHPLTEIAAPTPSSLSTKPPLSQPTSILLSMVSFSIHPYQYEPIQPPTLLPSTNYHHLFRYPWPFYSRNQIYLLKMTSPLTVEICFIDQSICFLRNVKFETVFHWDVSSLLKQCNEQKISIIFVGRCLTAALLE